MNIPKAGAFFDYSKKGANWDEGSCDLRNRQSPVNIELSRKDPPQLGLPFRYDKIAAPMTPFADGVFKFPSDDIGGLVYEQTYYPLYSAQLHTESEHTYFGKHNLLELQLFHKRPESDPIIAVSFLLQPPPVLKVNRTILDAAESKRVLTELQALGEKAPGFSRPMMHFLQPQKTNAWNALQINDLFRGATFWEYQGSLTKPPCSEVVSWLVRREPVSLSPRQAQLVYSNLRMTMQGKQNDRATFPLGERKIRVYAASEFPNGPQDPDIRTQHAPSVEDFAPIGPNPRPDRTDRMNGYAQAAMEASSELDQKSQELDYREQKAAFDYAKWVAPNFMKFVPPPVKPKFASYKFKGWESQALDPLKIAESMSKAVGSIAANALKSASDKIIKHTQDEAYKAAQQAFKDGEKKADEAKQASGLRVNMFR